MGGQIPSYELSSYFGAVLLTLVLSWLRAHGVRWPMRERVDVGTKFCGPSRRKLADWREAFRALGAEDR